MQARQSFLAWRSCEEISKPLLPILSAALLFMIMAVLPKLCLVLKQSHQLYRLVVRLKGEFDSQFKLTLRKHSRSTNKLEYFKLQSLKLKKGFSFLITLDFIQSSITRKLVEYLETKYRVYVFFYNDPQQPMHRTTVSSHLHFLLPGFKFLRQLFYLPLTVLDLSLIDF